MSAKKIGTVTCIRRYPVKSMAGESLDGIFVASSGMVGDRTYAFWDERAQESRPGLPFLTGREAHDLVLYKPMILNEPDPRRPYGLGYRPFVIVRPPGCPRTFGVNDPDFVHRLSSTFGRKLQFAYQGTGIFDQKPLSLLGVDTARAIGDAVGVSADPERFRENVYVSWACGVPFFEDTLVGRTLLIGRDVTVFVTGRNERCPMICLDSRTARYDKHVLAFVARTHEKRAGVYANIVHPGVVRVGDRVTTVGE